MRKGQRGQVISPPKGDRREYLKFGVFFFLNEFNLRNYCRGSFWQKELLGARCWNFAAWDEQKVSEWLCRRGQLRWWEIPAVKGKTLGKGNEL